MVNIYVGLTKEFNKGRLRSVISSGQAVVLHGLAIMSKDGDWILREDEETLAHVLGVLAGHGARYRFGAPLDVRWMSGGWSSHFEFRHDAIRIRTDFVTRPPRIRDLDRLWKEQEGQNPPFVNAKDLADLKKTNRELDYAVIGELARMITDVTDQLLFSRSARDLIALAEEHPNEVREAAHRRPVLKVVREGREKLEEALDAERRTLIRANEGRLRKYVGAAEQWRAVWRGIAGEIKGAPLIEAHATMVEAAADVLPFRVEGRGGHG